MIFNVSGLLSFIVYVTAFMLLVDRGVLLDLDTPPYKCDQIPFAPRFENTDKIICNASSGSGTTNLQLFCPNLLHNVTNVLGHRTDITK